MEGNLRITGDDALELMEAFFEHFGVDPPGFELARYFDGEGFGLLPLHWFIPRLRRKPRSSHQLTVGDLERALFAGKWVEPAWS